MLTRTAWEVRVVARLTPETYTQLPPPSFFRLEMASSAKQPPARRDSRILNVADTPKTVFAHVQNSSFGKFNEALKEIRPLLPDEVELELPRVVVVGSRDAGKSSLLENLTKCAIFPRDRGQCTKMPIKFQLQQVQDSSQCSCEVVYNGKSKSFEDTDDILAEVTDIMQHIDGFSDKEVVISLKQV